MLTIAAPARKSSHSRTWGPAPGPTAATRRLAWISISSSRSFLKSARRHHPWFVYAVIAVGYAVVDGVLEFVDVADS